MSITDGWEFHEVKQRTSEFDHVIEPKQCGIPILEARKSRNPTVLNTLDILDTWVYSTMCGYRKEYGWSLKSTSGSIKKKNFIRSIGIRDSNMDWMNVKYCGLNVEAFNTLSLTSETFSISIKVKKNSAMHDFVVAFFNHFCHNGGVMCS